MICSRFRWVVFSQDTCPGIHLAFGHNLIASKKVLTMNSFAAQSPMVSITTTCKLCSYANVSFPCGNQDLPAFSPSLISPSKVQALISSMARHVGLLRKLINLQLLRKACKDLAGKSPQIPPKTNSCLLRLARWATKQFSRIQRYSN